MKKKIISILTSAFLLLFVTSTFAQSGMSRKESIEKIKNRTLLVITEEPSDKLLKGLKADEIDEYKKGLEDYNSMMKDLVPKYWKFNDKIEFKTRTEVYKLVEAKDPNYAFLEYDKYRVQFANANSYYATRRACGFKDRPSGTNLLGGDYIKSEFTIRLTDDKMYSPPVYGVYMPTPCPNTADMVFALKSIQLQFKYKMDGLNDIKISQLFKTNASELQKLKLLINKQDTEASADDIKKVYPYPFELLDNREAIDKAILEGDPATAFVMLIPYTDKSFGYYVYRSSDIVQLASTNDEQSTGVSIGGIAAIDMARDLNRNKMKRDHFKIIAKQAGK